METVMSIAGNVGTDVEYVVGDGYAFASFRLATTPRVKKRGEWVNAETTWITVETAHRLAENVKNSVNKGDPVVVVGKLRTQRWNSKDGQRRERFVIEASSVGHDLTWGRSSFVRNERATPSFDQQSQPYGQDLGNDAPQDMGLDGQYRGSDDGSFAEAEQMAS